MARPVNAFAGGFNYITANPNETVSIDRSAEGSAGRFNFGHRKRFRSATTAHRSATELCFGELRTGMNLNGTIMNQRSMKLSTGSEDIELTRTEISCLKLTANGLKPAEIGAALHMDEKQIEIHLASAQHKLGARNRLHAVGIAVSQGLIGIDGK